MGHVLDLQKRDGKGLMDFDGNYIPLIDSTGVAWCHSPTQTCFLGPFVFPIAIYKAKACQWTMTTPSWELSSGQSGELGLLTSVKLSDALRVIKAGFDSVGMQGKLSSLERSVVMLVLHQASLTGRLILISFCLMYKHRRWSIQTVQLWAWAAFKCHEFGFRACVLLTWFLGNVLVKLF